jgi:hypothetical protein
MFPTSTIRRGLKGTGYIILITVLFSCESAKDYKINISNASINSAGGAFTISLEGKSERQFDGRIIIEGIELKTFQVQSSPNPDLSTIEFDIKELVDLAIFDTLISTNKLPTKIILYNADKEIKIDTTFNLPFSAPPIITTIRVIEPKQLSGNINLYSKRDFIRNLVRNGGHQIYNPKSKLLARMFTDTTQSLKISLEIDPTYDKTIIARWPSAKNKNYHYSNIQSVIIESAKQYESIESDSRNKRIERDVRMRYSGLNDICLISFKSKNEFVIIKLFETAVDNINPVFSNYSRVFTGDPQFEGHVFLRTEEFFGYSPYRVPFTGAVYGDIKQVLVEGVPIQFTPGEDIYVKRTLALDNGYNRINVTVIDKRGNRTKGFIEVTMERMTDEKVKIENNIDIDNN